MLDKLKKGWKAIAAVVGAVIGFLLLKQFLQKDLKAKLENANTAGKDAVLESKKSAVQDLLDKAEKTGEALEKSHEAAKDAADDMSKKDVEDFYKNRNKK